MMIRTLMALALIGLMIAGAIAQRPYSESTEYKPREQEKPEKKKKKAKVADAATQMQVPAGDITVTIPTSVLNRSGGAVSGLTASDMSVFVDDVEVPIASFEQDKEPLTVILLIDSSPSAQLRLKLMQEQASALVGSLPADVKVMVADFHDQMKVRSRPTVDRSETLAAIKKIEMGSGTSVYSAMQVMYEKVLPTVPGRKIIILMTDGVDTTSRSSSFPKSLTAVEKNDVSVYPVYFDTFDDGNQIRKQQLDSWLRPILGNLPTTGLSDAEYKRGLVYLNDLAVASGGRVFSSEKLADGTKSLMDELANKYYLTVTVPRKNAGSRTLRVRVNRPSVAVFARGSFVEK